MNADLPYRPCVGLMLFDRRGRIFVARRIDMPSEAWQMPQGGINSGEEPAKAALRELKEEIGTARAEIVAESPVWRPYDLPETLKARLWGGRFRGQTQKWFLLRFTGRDTDINIATRHPEFLEWKWVPVAEVPRLIVPFKRHIYEEVVAEFRPLMEGFVNPPLTPPRG
ncbi:MAG: RNA pyrophosphohydrolase [Proteobacteria bacterium]|nr:MAG: RNA pyrophosphohydrolase [Pseudomonadota bacterium]